MKERQDESSGTNVTETVQTYDTPIPDELRPAYDAWYRQLPENLQYTGDYDLQGLWLERLGRPTKYEATQDGHLDDYGKKPNHPTFSSGSKWHDPTIPGRTGGEWKRADDGSWDFYPKQGNILSDKELKEYFDKHERGNRVHPKEPYIWRGPDAEAARALKETRDAYVKRVNKNDYRPVVTGWPGELDSYKETAKAVVSSVGDRLSRSGKVLADLIVLPVGGKEPDLLFDKAERDEKANVRQASKGGNASGGSKASSVPSGHNAALDGYSGPRIVINPSTFRNEKDALCVAFDEAFRVVMEDNGFDPVAEPTEKQREFFSDTAYANDERMLRRTILARICTFDTSVTDPTDEQLQEAVEFLDTVMEIGAPQNNFEQRAVQRIRDAIAKTLESGKRKPAEQAQVPPQEGGENAKNGIDSDEGNMVSYEPEHGTGVNDVHQMS